MSRRQATTLSATAGTRRSTSARRPAGACAASGVATTIERRAARRMAEWGRGHAELTTGRRPLPGHASPLDPMSLGGAIAALVLTVLAASVLPVWRASRISPLEALRKGG